MSDEAITIESSSFILLPIVEMRQATWLATKMAVKLDDNGKYIGIFIEAIINSKVELLEVTVDFEKKVNKLLYGDI